jgi:flagellar assembly protein FliH
MGLIKRADIEEYTRDALVMDLSDLEQRGRLVVDAANTQAKEVLAQANTQREELISTAEEAGRDEGYKQGYAEGLAKGAEQGVLEARQEQTEMIAQLAQLWITQLDTFESQRDNLLEQARTQVVELGAMIAQRVTRRIVELDPSVVLSQMEAVLSSVTESTRLVLAVHPDDIEFAQQEVGGLIERFTTCEHAQIVSDPQLERGSCVGRTSSGGVIDATIPTQLDRILDGILPGRIVDSEAGEMNLPTDDADEDPQTQDDAA